MASAVALSGQRDPKALHERYFRERHPIDREALLERYLPLARHLAHRYGGGREQEDVEQVASLALLKAIDRFDPSRGIAFTSFAVPTILGEVKRYFRDLGWSVRVPRSLQELAASVEKVIEELTGELGRTPTTNEIAHRCDVSPERVLEARAAISAHHPDSLDRPTHDDELEPRAARMSDVEHGYQRAEHAADLDRMLASLSDRERLILRLRFEEDLVQREIAAQLGVSQMHVSRLLRQAIEKLRDTHD